jgi:hypothetical protein
MNLTHALPATLLCFLLYFCAEEKDKERESESRLLREGVHAETLTRLQR